MLPMVLAFYCEALLNKLARRYVLALEVGGHAFSFTTS